MLALTWYGDGRDGSDSWERLGMNIFDSWEVCSNMSISCETSMGESKKIKLIIMKQNRKFNINLADRRIYSIYVKYILFITRLNNDFS